MAVLLIPRVTPIINLDGDNAIYTTSKPPKERYPRPLVIELLIISALTICDSCMLHPGIMQKGGLKQVVQMWLSFEIESAAVQSAPILPNLPCSLFSSQSHPVAPVSAT
jgi:hypothetical protein